jgi:hypothetical protein
VVYINKDNASMDTDRVKLLKCQRIINAYFKNEGENDVGCALDGLVGIIQHSDQDHILEKAIKMVCAVLFCSSFFSEKDKRLFVQTIDEASQRYGWDFNKNMVN